MGEELRSKIDQARKQNKILISVTEFGKEFKRIFAEKWEFSKHQSEIVARSKFDGTKIFVAVQPELTV